jgi:hypothetical protein
MTGQNSRLIAIIASMTIAGFASQAIPLTAAPKALTVGLLAALVFISMLSALSRNRPA